MPSLSLSRMSSWDCDVNKLNFSANVTRGIKSITFKFLNKISAFFFSIRSLCNMRERSQGKKYCLRSGFMSGRREVVTYKDAWKTVFYVEFLRNSSFHLLSAINTFFWKIVVKRFRQRRRLHGWPFLRVWAKYKIGRYQTKAKGLLWNSLFFFVLLSCMVCFVSINYLASMYCPRKP